MGSAQTKCLAALGIGLLAGAILGAMLLRPSGSAPVTSVEGKKASPPAKASGGSRSVLVHHDIQRGFHISCIKYTPTQARAIVEQELRSPTMSIVSDLFPPEMRRDFEIEDRPGTPSAHRYHVYFRSAEKSLGVFEVDHLHGSIQNVLREDLAISRPQATQIALDAFKRRSHPYLAKNGPPADANIVVDKVYFRRSSTSWVVLAHVAGSESNWVIGLSSDGKINHISRDTP